MRANLPKREEYIGLPPGDEPSEKYEATTFVRGGGKGGAGYLWFACADASRDRILPLANLRDMEPGDMDGPCSYLHFSGMIVKLEGRQTRRAVHRIFLGRCTGIHEIRPGQKPISEDDAIIQRITFLVPPPPEKAEKEPPPRSKH